MRTAPKVAISLFITLLLFAGLVFWAYGGLFSLIETRFYQNSIISSLQSNLDTIALETDRFHTVNITRFSEFVTADAVRRTLLPTQAREDIVERADLAGKLLSEIPGLSGIRIIDAGTGTTEERLTRRLHFSTWKEDILKQDQNFISWQHYGKNPEDLPVIQIESVENQEPRVLFHADADRFLYSFPFTDSYGTYRGTAIFYVSARGATRQLVASNLFKITDDLRVIGNPDSPVHGTITGLPATGKEILTAAVNDKWSSGIYSTERVVNAEGGDWVLITSTAARFGLTGQLVRDDLFTFPAKVKILFLGISFITIFLVLFLLFNLKQDDLVVIRSRLRRFQYQLVQDFLSQNQEIDWEEIQNTVSARKHDINRELKKSFGRRLNKKFGSEIDSLLDRSWEEILSALGKQKQKQSALPGTDELKALLEQVIRSSVIQTAPAPGLLPQSAQAVSTATASIQKTGSRVTAPEAAAMALSDQGEAVEELEDLDDASPAEEIEEVLEEFDETEEVLEETESGSAEEVEAVEEIEEAEEVETLEELDELVELDELAETEETESAEPESRREPPSPKPDEPRGDRPHFDLTEIPTLIIGNHHARASSTETTETRDTDITVQPYPLEISPDMDESPTADAEPEEVEYLDGEWELDTLEEATDAEFEKFVAEVLPDQVLIYNFEETPHLDGRTEPFVLDIAAATANDDPMNITGPDFSFLDGSLDGEDATTVNYIDSVLFSLCSAKWGHYPESAAAENLEVIGEDEPGDLLESNAENPGGSDVIVSEDGLYLISGTQTGESIDTEFKSLVDSVL